MWSLKCLQEILIEIWRVWTGKAREGDLGIIHTVLTVETHIFPSKKGRSVLKKPLTFAICLK